MENPETRPDDASTEPAPEAVGTIEETPAPVTSTPPGPGDPAEDTDLTPDEASAALGADAPGTENPYPGTEPILQDGGE